MRDTDYGVDGYSTVKVLLIIGALVAAAVVGMAVVGTFFTGLGDEVEETRSPQRYAQSQQTEFEVQSGEVTVDSADADEDVQQLKTRLYMFDGELRAEERSEDARTVKHTVEVRVADDEFDGFVEWLYEEYEVSSADVGYETVELSETRNEIDVLVDAMEVYEGVVEHYDGRRGDVLTSQDVQMVSLATQKRMEVARDLNSLNYDVEQVERRAERPTVEIVFRETVEPSMMPEGLGNEVRASVANGLGSVSDGLAAVVAAPLHALALLLMVVRLGIYTVVIGVPLGLAYYVFARSIEDRL